VSGDGNGKATRGGSPRAVLRDIAERAGVSLMTVSRVLNGKPDVAPATRDAVLRHAYELGYVSHRNARGRASRRTGLIALTIPYVRGEGDYFAEIMAGVTDALYERDARVVLCPTRHEHDREASLLGRLLHGTTDGGLLIAPSESAEELAALRIQGYPFVVVDPIAPPGEDTVLVTATNAAGGRAATKHLIALGHRRIGVISGPRDWPASVDRLAGYHAALVTAGLPVLPELVVESDFRAGGGEAAAERLLAQPEPPTAIFAFNDNMAIGASRAAARHGLTVPADLSVVGFDDTEAASLVAPALTTVRQPLQEMGRAAVGLLYRQIERQRLDAARLEVSTSLVIRASTAPCGA
jgi:LacI family transcriptional regulator